MAGSTAGMIFAGRTNSLVHRVLLLFEWSFDVSKWTRFDTVKIPLLNRGNDLADRHRLGFLAT